MYDRLGELMGTVYATSGKEPPKFPTYPRPRLARDRLRSHRRWDKHKRLVARLIRR